MVKIFFRVDYSKIIGSGHLSRCKILIKELIKDNKIFLIARANSDEKIIIKKTFKDISAQIYFLKPKKKIKKKIYSTWLRYDLKKDALETKKILKKNNINKQDILVIDHYGIENNWIKSLKIKNKIIFLDDYIKKDIKKGIIINGNVNAKKNFYSISKTLQVYSGSKYAILKNKYSPNYKLKQKKNILIFFSNSDLNKFYLKVINTLKTFKNFNFFVITGFQNKIKKNNYDIKNIKFFSYVKNFEKLLKKTSLAIGSCGSTYLQRLYYNIPSIIYSLSDNQKPFCNFLDKNKISLYLGSEKKFDPKQLKHNFMKIANDNKKLLLMSNKSKFFIDKYSLRRVLEIIKPSIKNNLFLKKVKSDQLDLMFNWVNNSEVVNSSIKKKKISYQEHKQWFKKSLVDPHVKIFIFFLKGLPIGQIRFNKNLNKYSIDYSLDEFVRGKGFGKILVSMGMKKIKKKKNEILEAVVKKDNKKSIKIFNNLNFSSTRMSKNLIKFQYV